MTRAEIDLNIRFRDDQTYVGFEDFTGDFYEGMTVEVYESESGVTGMGRVVRIDDAKEIVYIAVDWAGLKPSEPGSSSS